MEHTLHDLRVALRSLRRNPGFALAAIVTLALGIGVNTAIFSLVYAVLLSPLPYPNADRLAFIWANLAKDYAHAPMSGRITEHSTHGADRFRHQFRRASVRPELLRLAKRGKK